MKKVYKISLIVMLVIGILGISSAAGLYYWASRDLPGFKNVTDYNPPLVTTVYTHDNKVLGYFYKEKRFLVRMDEMTPLLSKAFLAAEDASFYEHDGVDFSAISRAFVANLRGGSIKQGGSTITQQIIKRLLLTPEKSYKRKIKEAILAFRLEHYLEKDEILTIYLNQIYLGAGAYGVEAAARVYFGKHVSDLTVAECALLAGLPQAPSRYDPYRHPERAKARQLYVLGQMYEHRWIDRDQYNTAIDQQLVYKSMEDPSWQNGPYYLEEVRRWLLDKYGEEAVYYGGLNVVTACDLKHQKAADDAVRTGLENSSTRRGWKGPLAHLQPADFQKFLTTDVVPVSDLKPGYWVKVLVTKVAKTEASVKFGKYSAKMPVTSMHWCRKPDIRKAHDQVRPVKDATTVLKSGDVVWAKLTKAFFKDGSEVNFNQVSADAAELEGVSWTVDLVQRPVVEGALVSMDPRSGEIKAMVGGYSFHKSQFNRATQAKRQPGSAFKPIVYSTAMDNGYTPASIMMDAPFVYTDMVAGKLWKPENFEGVFYGPTLLRTALVKSRNLVTIRLAQKMGISKIVERAKTMGLEGEFPHDLSVALGSASVTLINMIEAYSAFARGGTSVKARLVLTVNSAWGELLYESKPEVHDAISPQTAYIMCNLLKEVVQRGTGWRAKVLGRPVAGKTGTTNNEQDAWYMGFSPYLLTGVFVGFDQLTPMGKWETGSRAASPIWVSYRKEVEKDYPYMDFPQPDGVVMAKIDAASGLLAGPGSSETFFLPFKEGTQPTKTATGSGSGSESGGSSSEDLFKQTF
ncbi:penicillin-binding protein 1A [Maridesulfovibrio ferrireducens]|uniref:penicillin-binding protein 1A n=1 Tax=Maridesulfovibrio ferrireducens TaxID=246191 RepID=UPI001A189332|nr:PBP1A family penicillin-binding protein [Maridesulfovibrio ferrireducens]MBI9110047.1 PBP1A family penicillin-binding protein [Maridesulfovibrio ferrireducens]